MLIPCPCVGDDGKALEFELTITCILFYSFIGVNCYSSSDFVSWERVGHVLSPQAGTNISDSQIVERPKVIYNEKNEEYVMWFHGK